MGGASKILMLLSTPFPLLYPRPSSSSAAAALRLARHSRTAAFAASAHHHPFTRSAPLLRPKAPFRSQLHTQSAQREGHSDSPLGGSAPVPWGSASLGRLWPEWTKLVENLTAGGYSGRGSSGEVAGGGDDDDSFAVLERIPDEFERAAGACLAFARERPEALRLFAKKNLEVIVDRGSPSLFKNGASSARRMRMFLNGDESNVLESERAQTVDVMRYVLSYAYDSLSASEGIKHKDAELVEASVRSLLAEFVNMSGMVQFSKFTEFSPRRPPVSHEQFSRPPGQIIEMKRGDWICPKCSFMNFARNSRCLECEEARPKRELTGGEWECPQCDFYNYGRNMSCLRCDCKRPGEIPLSTSLNKASSVDQILSGSNTGKSEFEQRLAANDEKGEKWFSKVSQLGDKADTSSAAADEDFPEIMPLRKSVNRFVVSTRKTPLERRLANSHSGVSSGSGSDRTSDSAISKSLDRILGRTSTPAAAGEADTGAGSRFNPSEYRQSIAKGDPGHVPFVPLPPDMFSKPQNSNNEVKQENPASLNADAPSRDSPTGSSTSLNESKNNNESSDASERWSKKVVGLDNVTDLASAIPDEDFPEIMPMRRGENRFVVSKKKDRSLTSPQYKRRLAMEQTNKSDFVPFVPFPPGYFAKKDKQPEAAPPPAPNNEAVAESSTPPENFQALPEKQENKTGTPNWASTGNISQQPGSRIFSQSQSYNTQFHGNNLNESRVDNIKESGNSELSQMSSSSNSTSATWGSTQEVSKSQSSTSQSWNKVFSGKSLEGSAVTEPDPLDMSEEAKAARWFRRAAQIKNISELSEIPDEDFPEIMPMRKGVNRFVVSKRKTPLERRLTSPQYRRNLPIVSSEPEKDAS